MNDAGRVGFVPKNNYNAGTTYDYLDIVYFEGSSYVAKKVTAGNTPAEDNEYWHIFAAGAQPAGPNTPGTVKPDGTTTQVTSGVISAIVLEKDGELATSD